MFSNVIDFEQRLYLVFFTFSDDLSHDFSFGFLPLGLHCEWLLYIFFQEGEQNKPHLRDPTRLQSHQNGPSRLLPC